MTESTMRFLIVFTLIFLCYQAAEGIGIRLLNSPLWQAIFMIGTIPLAFILGQRFYHAPLGAFALEVKPRVVQWLLITFAFAVSAKAIALLLGRSFGIYTVQANGQHVDWHLLPAAALVFITTFIPSLAEDILTRGLLLRHGPVRRGLTFIAFSSIVYVLNHVYRLGNGPMEWMMLACFGIAYATACVRTDSLWAAVGLHWGWNAANGLFPLFLSIEVLQRDKAMLLSAVIHLVLSAICAGVFTQPSGHASDARRLSSPP
jgi:uncharacterized protein